MVQFIGRLRQPKRQEGGEIQGVWPAATWIDNRVLAAGVAETYTLPTDTDTPASKGTMLRLSGNGPVYLNPNGTAAPPAGDTTDGTGSIYWDLSKSPWIGSFTATAALSILSPGAMTVSIEVWS